MAAWQPYPFVEALWPALCGLCKLAAAGLDLLYIRSDSQTMKQWSLACH